LSLRLAVEAALPGQDFKAAARDRQFFVASGGPTPFPESHLARFGANFSTPRLVCPAFLA